jgi:hypothetical protein
MVTAEVKMSKENQSGAAVANDALNNILRV